MIFIVKAVIYKLYLLQTIKWDLKVAVGLFYHILLIFPNYTCILQWEHSRSCKVVTMNRLLGYICKSTLV